MTCENFLSQHICIELFLYVLCFATSINILQIFLAERHESYKA